MNKRQKKKLNKKVEEKNKYIAEKKILEERRKEAKLKEQEEEQEQEQEIQGQEEQETVTSEEELETENTYLELLKKLFKLKTLRLQESFVERAIDVKEKVELAQDSYEGIKEYATSLKGRNLGKEAKELKGQIKSNINRNMEIYDAMIQVATNEMYDAKEKEETEILKVAQFKRRIKEYNASPEGKKIKKEEKRLAKEIQKYIGDGDKDKVEELQEKYKEIMKSDKSIVYTNQMREADAKRIKAMQEAKRKEKETQILKEERALKLNVMKNNKNKTKEGKALAEVRQDRFAKGALNFLKIFQIRKNTKLATKYLIGVANDLADNIVEMENARKERKEEKKEIKLSERKEKINAIEKEIQKQKSIVAEKTEKLGFKKEKAKEDFEFEMG